jgi:DNA-binding transcriptional LysR family regulator
MTLKQLVYFLKIAETGNLTKAAQILHMFQPPLSYQLKLLEDELGVTLFVRDARNLQITNEGIYFQDKAIQIMSLLEKASGEIKNISSSAVINISIGTVTSINHSLLPKAVGAYKKQHPNALFNIYDGSSFRIIELLNNNVIDFGILREPFNKDLYSHVLIRDSAALHNDEDDYFVVAGHEVFFKNAEPDTIKLEELACCPLIVHRRFEDLLMSVCNQINVTPNIICRNDNIISSIEWSSNGIGIGIMPYTSSLLISDKRLIVKKIIAPSFYSNLYLIWNSNTKLPNYIKEFIDLFLC